MFIETVNLYRTAEEAINDRCDEIYGPMQDIELRLSDHHDAKYPYMLVRVIEDVEVAQRRT